MEVVKKPAGPPEMMRTTNTGRRLTGELDRRTRSSVAEIMDAVWTHRRKVRLTTS